MKNSLIFQVGMKVLLPILLLCSFLIFWRGHQLPGGGFIGGLVAGAALATYAFCFGADVMLKFVRLQPLTYVFAGLTCALLSGLLSFSQGLEPFVGLWTSAPLIGSIGTPVMFDLGVYLLVIGFVLVFVSETLKGEA